MHSVDKAFQIFSEVIYIAVHCRMQSRKKNKCDCQRKKVKKNNTCMYVIYHGCRTCRVYF